MSSAVKFDIDMKEFEGALAELSEAGRGQALKEAADAGAFVLEAEIKQNINRQGLIDKGQLINSVQKRKTIVMNDRAETSVGTNVVYGPIHEFGGVIKPRKAQALRFQTKDGQWHTVKSVTIPARPYMRPAADEGREKISSAVAATLKRIINAVKK